RFTQQYPGIEIELLSTASLADLNSRQADIALRMSPKPPEYLIGKKILPLRHGLYASEKYLNDNNHNKKLILWDNDRKTPEWVSQHFPNAAVAVRVSEIMSMLECVKHHLGIARMPCYVADAEPTLRRLDLPLTPSIWGVWVLSHVDLRSTARVRVCRDFLTEIIEEQRGLIEGLNSNYY
ncbi:MAG: LysR substrate-binding domain-containing protein, partial [Colwellia sp.]